MGKVISLSFVAAVNPTLLAATTVMLLLPRPERLMLGYWFGAMVTGVTLGLVIVFVLEGSSFEQASKKTAHPAIVLALAGILWSSLLCSPPALTSPFRNGGRDGGNPRRHRDGSERYARAASWAPS